MSRLIIQTRHLAIGYPGKKEPVRVQTELDLSILRGELVCLIGPNGCGKSTLLRTLAGLQPLLSGEIRIDGRPLQKQSLKEKAKLLALVLTDRVEVSNLTVEQLVSTGRNPYTGWLGRLGEEDWEKVRVALTQVHLQGYGHRFISELSDGEKQRALIAKALVQDTPVIFLDEPTAHLDLPNRVEVMLLLRTLAKETAKSVILSTHELDLALQAADKLWLMSPHGGITVGTPEDLVLNESIQRVFANLSFRFDISTGNFIMNHPGVLPPVCLQTTGEGIRTYWTRRALSRQGYSLSSEGLLTVTVDENSACWKLSSGNQDATVFSLEELFNKISFFIA